MLISRARSAAQQCVWLVACVIAFACAPVGQRFGAVARADEPVVDTDDVIGRRDLAERMAQLAKASLLDRPLVSQTLRQAAALLEAAATEFQLPRYYRLLASDYQQLHDTDKQLAALQTYLKFPANNSSEGFGDQGAMIDYIDLQLNALQSLDAKLKYAQQTADNDKVPAEVRAHGAFIACRLQEQRLDPTSAKKALDQALQLNPVSLEALRYRFGQVRDNGTPTEVVGALLDLLQANPVQPAVMSSLADELVHQGLPDQGVNWYTNASSLTLKLGQPRSPDTYLDYACALLVTQQNDRANDAAQELLKADPTNVQAAFLRLLIARRGDPKTVDAAQAGVADAIAQELSALHGRVVGRQPATRPAEDEANDAGADLAKLKSAGDEATFMAYIGALENLASLEIYFEGRTAPAQPLLATLRQNLAPDDVAIARLEGFSFINDKKYDQAAVKLSAVADRDPLSKMGMILVAQAKGGDPAKISKQASDLVVANQGGLLGVILVDGLRSLGGEPGPTPYTDAIHDRLLQFPRRWLDILEYGKAEQFYNMKVEPVNGVQHDVGNPMLVRVTIQCTSEFPVTIGDDATLRPDLFFDARTRGLFSSSFPPVYDQIAGPLVLHKGDLGVSQVIRIDDPSIDMLLNQSTVAALPLYFSLFTNPVTQNTGIVPGPAGYRREFTDLLERVANPINTQNDVSALEQKLTQGSINEKMNTLDLLVTFIRNGRLQIQQVNAQGAQSAKPDTGAPADGTGGAPSQQQAADAYQKVIDDYQLWIRTSERDDSPQVRAWAGYCAGLVAQGPDQLKVTTLLATREGWEDRVLATALLRELSADQAKALAKQIAAAAKPSKDPAVDAQNAIVRVAAEAAFAAADVPPTTQPARQPATQPATPAPSVDGAGGMGGPGQ